ncbi:MAG: hypothetical protein ABJH05_06860 [Fulvivirga sp.]
MESTIDLILKGHFHTIKEDVEATTGRNESLKMLCASVEEAINYLKKQNDKESKALINKLSATLHEIIPAYGNAIEMKKKPMKKAGKKNVDQSQKKAM